MKFRAISSCLTICNVSGQKDVGNKETDLGCSLGRIFRAVNRLQLI